VTKKKREDAQRTEETGVVAPEDQVIDPANTGPATSNPDAEPTGGFSGETAVPDRRERQERGGK
jgi:hypothetical protein